MSDPDGRIEAPRLTQRQKLQLQAIADTSVDLSEEEDVVVVAERLAQIRKDRGEARRRASGNR
jgi:hypothetical protein